MVGNKIPFLDKQLFLNLSTQRELLKTYDANSVRQFFKNYVTENEGENKDGLTFDDFINVIFFDLKWKDNSITKNDTESLINKWMEEGNKGDDDLYLLVFEVLTNAQIYPKNSFDAMVKRRNLSEDQREEIIENIVKDRINAMLRIDDILKFELNNLVKELDSSKYPMLKKTIELLSEKEEPKTEPCKGEDTGEVTPVNPSTNG
jgi:hypothetical protein